MMIDLDRHMQGNAFRANDFCNRKKKKGIYVVKVYHLTFK